ncbi:MAG: RDD family protein [Rhodanobacter sp.]
MPVLAYFWLFHASHGHATPGKLLVGIELREAGLQPLGIGAMAMRSLYALLTLLSVGSRYVWALFDRRGRALHDWLGASVVVGRDTDPMFAIPTASLEPSTAILYVIASYLMQAIAMIPCALVFNAILR